MQPLDLPAKIERLRRPLASLLHLELRCAGSKRHLVFVLEPPLAGPVELDAAPLAGTPPHPSQAMLRQRLGAALVGVRRAPGLWEMILADGSVLCVSWRRKTRGVWWADESRLGGEPHNRLPPLDQHPLNSFEAARIEAQNTAWRKAERQRLERLAAKLNEQAKTDDPDDLRELGQRANAQRHQLRREDGVWLIPSWDGSTVQRFSGAPATSPSQLVDQLFNRARRAERRRDAVAQRIEAIEGELKGLDQMQAPATRKRHPHEPKSAPRLTKGLRRFDLNDGHHLLVGRNAQANHALTFKLGRGRDLWFHLRDGPGSHVLLPLEKGEEVGPDLLLAGAALALHYSSLRGERSEVRIAYRRDLDALPGSPGKVLVRRERVLLVDPRGASTQATLERLGLILQMPS